MSKSFKCVLLGSSGVGKTSIVLRAKFNHNSNSTIGALEYININRLHNEKLSNNNNTTIRKPRNSGKK
jgi:hypothetical protein